MKKLGLAGLFGILAFIILLSGCSINNNIMLKTDKDYVFDSIPENPETEYRISVDDIITFRLYANDGFKIIELASGVSQGGGGTGGNNNLMNNRNVLSYVVDVDGMVKLPLIGRIELKGKTVRETEEFLEEVYGEYYVDPFAQVNVTNKRVIIFPGEGSNARVVNLANNNTTLIEVIAQSGGITSRGKANRIKIIREFEDVYKVYLIDLSTIDGINNANMVVQANDIIYVEPVPEIAREIVKDIAPIISLLSSAFVIWAALQRI